MTLSQIMYHILYIKKHKGNIFSMVIELGIRVFMLMRSHKKHVNEIKSMRSHKSAIIKITT